MKNSFHNLIILFLIIMDLLIPVNIISSLNHRRTNKDRHQILNNICGLQTLNIHDEKQINLVTQHGKMYYVVHNAKNFVLNDLKFANILIKQQYFKICSIAFILGIGKDCFLKNDTLFMYNVNDQKKNDNIPNILRFLSPRELMEVIDNVYKILDLFEIYNLISNDVKLTIKDKYQTQVINDMF